MNKIISGRALKIGLFGGLLLLVLVSMVTFASAATVENSPKLLIEKIDAKVGGKSDKDVKDKETISREAEPGDKIKIEVTIKNNFTTTEAVDEIEDIEVEVTVDNLEEDEELELLSREFDLKPQRDKEVAFEFDVPVEVDEDTYDILIEVEGRDTNGTTHRKQAKIFLTVDKETHDLRIFRKVLSAAEVSCSRKNQQLTLGIINAGSEEEEDIILTATNKELGIDIKEKILELSEGAFDNDVKFVRTYTFNVPQDLAAGTYPINILVNYDDNRKSVTDTISMVVNDCQQTVVAPPTTTTTVSPTQPKEEEKVEEVEEVVELISPEPAVIQPTVITTPTIMIPEATVEKGFFNSNWFVVFLIGAEAIVALLVIGLIIRLARK